MVNTEKRNLAQDLYIKGTLTRKAIADAVGVTEKTLRNWIEKYGWDDIREAMTVTRKQLLTDAYTQLKKVNKQIEDNEGVITKELADAKSILRKEIEQLSESPLHVYVDVLDEFTEYLARKSPKNLQTFSKLVMGFLEGKYKEA